MVVQLFKRNWLENRGLDDVLPPPTWYVARVDGKLLRGAEPSGRHWREINDLGVRSVVSLQREEPSEAPQASRFGMNTLHLSITDNTAPTMSQVKAFLDFATQAQNQPVYVHCRAGKGRTGVMVAAYRMAVSGWSPAAAIGEAKAMGMRMPSQEQLLRDFADALRRGQVAGYPLLSGRSA